MFAAPHRCGETTCPTCPTCRGRWLLEPKTVLRIQPIARRGASETPSGHQTLPVSGYERPVPVCIWQEPVARLVQLVCLAQATYCTTQFQPVVWPRFPDRRQRHLSAVRPTQNRPSSPIHGQTKTKYTTLISSLKKNYSLTF